MRRARSMSRGRWAVRRSPRSRRSRTRILSRAAGRRNADGRINGMRSFLALLVTAMLSLSMTKAPTGVTRTFDITAYQFGYTVTPFPFSVAVGDTVVIRATSGDVVHGLVMDPYVRDAVTLVPGETVTRTFVADTRGRFTFGCTSYCGFGHFGMAGSFFVFFGRGDSFSVYSPDGTAPAIASLAPLSGPVQGATLAINGSNFSRNTR